MAKEYTGEERGMYDWDSDVQDMLSGMPDYDVFMEDPMSMMLLDIGLFNDEVSIEERSIAREMLDEYWMEEYGYSFDDVFDWDAWKEWMGYE